MGGKLRALLKLYLLLHTVDLSSQPLDHPVHLGDLLFGVSEVIAMSARRDLQLLVLREPEQSESWAGCSRCTAWPSVPQEVQPFTDHSHIPSPIYLGDIYIFLAHLLARHILCSGSIMKNIIRPPA